MTQHPVIGALALLLAGGLMVEPAAAQGRGRDRGPAVRRAIPRDRAPRVVGPQVVRVVPYRYRAPYGVGLYYGYPGRYYGYPYRYGYRYPYSSYRYAPPGYFVPVPGRVYGGVRIDLDVRHAEVLVDGYYVGTVDDFDGVFQQVHLQPGPHRVDVRAPGYEPIRFEVNVLPGQTITYRAPMLPLP